MHIAPGPCKNEMFCFQIMSNNSSGTTACTRNNKSVTCSCEGYRDMNEISPLIVANHFSVSPKITNFSLEDLKILHSSGTQLCPVYTPDTYPAINKPDKEIQAPMSMFGNSENQQPKLPCLSTVFDFFSDAISGWWFQTFFIFTPTWGNDPIWLFFSDGLKPPTSYFNLSCCARLVKPLGGWAWEACCQGCSAMVTECQPEKKA